jgi:hypothetical protein
MPPSGGFAPSDANTPTPTDSSNSVLDRDRVDHPRAAQPLSLSGVSSSVSLINTLSDSTGLW